MSMLKIKTHFNCHDWHQVTYSAELRTLICNIHILPQTSLHEHYTVLLLEGRELGHRDKGGGEGKKGTERE